MKHSLIPSSIPPKPGVYVFKDDKANIMYIGKAKHLRKRVSSYFSKHDHDDKTRQLIARVADIDFIITPSESEALLLEANLIKQHQPKYNIDLKGGKRYAYIVLTNEPYPRLLSSRYQSLKGEYFGPFVYAHLRHALISTLQKTFFIRTCKTLPKKPCLRYHIGLCKAPCVNYQSKEEYDANIALVRDFLKGKNRDLIKDLQVRMSQASTQLNFERATELRDQIKALRYLQERSLVERQEHIYEDVISFLQVNNKVHVAVFTVRNGLLGEKEIFSFVHSESFFDEFLRRYYEDQSSSIPSLIIVPLPVEQSTIDYLSQKASHKVECRVPQRGPRRDLLDLVHNNLLSTISGSAKALHDLQNSLGLETLPHIIECFDISHFQGSFMVGAMSRFVDAKPANATYRRYKINTLDGVDDVRAIQEIVRRRYRRLISQNHTLPDLILIDGGQQQLAFAIKGLEEAGVNIPIVALAKKFEEIYIPQRRLPLRLPKSSDAMKLLIALRNEAHRFGVSYHRLLRSKALKQS